MANVKLTITNIDKGPRGVNLARGGVLLLEPGQTVKDIELKAAEADDLSTEWFTVGSKTETEKAPPKAPFEAKEKSPGWFAIFDADGNAVGKSFREEDAKAFNALGDDDKQKTVDEAMKASQAT